MTLRNEYIITGAIILIIGLSVIANSIIYTHQPMTEFNYEFNYEFNPMKDFVFIDWDNAGATSYYMRYAFYWRDIWKTEG